MWKIREGDAKILHTMKLVPPDDLVFRESKVPETLNASSLLFLSVTRYLEWMALELTKLNCAFYKHLRACTNFLEMYDN